MTAEILFWLAVAAIFHSYILFPFILKILASRKKNNLLTYNENEDLPYVSILLSVYNEEEVISEKIESMFASNYPTEKFEIIIGSDNSSDKTNQIIQQYTLKHKQLHFYPFTKRQGKISIINQLSEKAKADILILTDANVMFDSSTVYHAVKHMKNKEIGLVDTNMINKGIMLEGISFQEKAYISREVRIKNNEGLVWGTMMGPFGGCFAIRKELFSKIPSNYTVDDFYLNMKVLEKGKRSINELEARVYEDVSNNLHEEFRRKVRIATGNFQNLVTFFNLLYPFGKQLNISRRGLAFCFFSHKVIRWLGPFLLLTAFISNLILIHKLIYSITFAAYIFSLLIPLLDYMLRKFEINIILFRFITHFYSMNLALALGFYKFMKGVKTNVWQPTKRNQGRESKK